MSFVECKNVSFKVSNEDDNKVILNNINLDIDQGDFIAILGKSGSGKTTLLNCMVGLIEPTNGQIIVDNHIVNEMNDAEKTYWRRYDVGYVFQNYGLIEILSVYDNIALSTDLSSQFSMHAKKIDPSYERHEKVDHNKIATLMKRLNIWHLKDKFPHELSGGQQQRVSLSRIISKQPKIIFADEPTGALDHETSIEAMDLLLELNCSGSTIIMITHNEELVKYCNKVIRISDGEIIKRYDNDNSKLKEAMMNKMAQELDSANSLYENNQTDSGLWFRGNLTSENSVTVRALPQREIKVIKQTPQVKLAPPPAPKKKINNQWISHPYNEAKVKQDIANLEAKGGK